MPDLAPIPPKVRARLERLSFEREKRLINPLVDAETNLPRSGRIGVGASTTNGSEIIKGNFLEQIAHCLRSETIRDWDSLQALLRLVRQTPESYQIFREFMRRGRELENNTVKDPDIDRTRRFARLFAGLAASAHTNFFSDLVIQREVERQSTRIWANLDEMGTIPEIIIGTGPNAAAYASARFAASPNRERLCVEKRKKIGGQFAITEGPGWRLNSRTKINTPEEPSIPGKRESLNSLGKKAVSQQADFTMMAYGSNSSMARPTKVNLLLSTRVLADKDIISVEKNQNISKAARWQVEFYDADSGTSKYGPANKVTSISGIGRPGCAVDKSDPETEKILAEQSVKAKKGERPTYMTFNQFEEWISQPGVPFPLQGIKRVIIIADKDSARVATATTLGYEYGLGASVNNLDYVQKLVWVGQKKADKDAYIDEVRCRYTDVSVEFPRSGIANYASRILPIDERAQRLQRGSTKDSLVLVTRDAMGKGQTFEGDLIIDCSGFINDAANPFSRAICESLTPSDLVSRALSQDSTSVLKPGTKFIFERKSKFDYVEILDVKEIPGDKLFIEVRQRTKAGKIVEGALEINNRNDTIAQFLINPFDQGRKISRVDIAQVPEVKKWDYVRVDNEIVGRTLKDCPSLVIAGPAAQIPLQEIAKDQNPALKTVPENSAAIFRYVNQVVKLASLGDEAPVIPDIIQQGFVPIRPSKQIKVAAGKTPLKYSVECSSKDAMPSAQIPFEMAPEVLLKFAAAQHLIHVRAPAKTKPWLFEVTADVTGRTLSYEVKAKLPADKNSGVTEALDSFFKDPMTIAALSRLLDLKVNPSQTLTLAIPFELERKTKTPFKNSPNKFQGFNFGNLQTSIGSS